MPNRLLLILTLFGFHLFGLLGSANCQNKDTLYIEKTLFIPKGKKENLSQYSHILMGPGTMIWVEGSLIINPSEGRTTKITSRDPSMLAKGIVIGGHNHEEIVDISNISFELLDQAIYFEPFWSRSRVSIRNFSINRCGLAQPIVSVHNPFLNPKTERINFELTNGLIFNNFSGIIFDDFASIGTQYKIQDIHFYHNHEGSHEDQLGLLHLDLSNSFQTKQVDFKNLSFSNNFTEITHSISISASGSNKQVLNLGTVAVSGPFKIMDEKTNPRLPKINFSETPISNKFPACNPTLVGKTFNSVDILYLSDLCGEPILYSNDGSRIPITTNRIGDTTRLIWKWTLSKTATYISFETNDLRLYLSPLTKKIGDTQIGSSDDTVVSQVILQKLIKEISDNKSNVIVKATDSLVSKSTLSSLVLPGGKDTIVTKEKILALNEAIEDMESELGLTSKAYFPTQEIGYSKGLAFYLGDLKYPYGLPTYLDHSWSIFYERKLKPRKSLRIEGHYTRIGFGNSSAFFSYGTGRGTFLTDPKNNNAPILINQSQIQFRTDIFGLSYNQINSLPGIFRNNLRWSMEWGWGAGLIRFDPYRVLSYNKDKAINTDSIALLPLRTLGTEGQNSNPAILKLGPINLDYNLHEYGPYAILLNSFLRVSYRTQGFRFSFELKYNLPLTDYLDDFGLGRLYGGNYSKWVNSNQNIELPSNPTRVNPSTGEPIPYNINSVFQDISSIKRRSTGVLPDSYVQLHFGVSYNFEDLRDGLLNLRKSKKNSIFKN